MSHRLSSLNPHELVCDVKWATRSNQEVFVLVWNDPEDQLYLRVYDVHLDELIATVLCPTLNRELLQSPLFVVPGDQCVFIRAKHQLGHVSFAGMKIAWYVPIDRQTETFASNNGNFVLWQSVINAREDKRICLMSKAPFAEWPIPISEDVVAAAFTWDSRAMYCIEGDEGVVRKRYLETDKETGARPIAHIVHHDWNTPASCVACSPVDGRWCVGDKRGVVTIYSAEADEFGQPKREFTIACFSHCRAIQRVLFTFTGNTIVLPGSGHFTGKSEVQFIALSKSKTKEGEPRRYVFRPWYECNCIAATDGYMQLQVTDSQKKCCAVMWHGDCHTNIGGPAIKNVPENMDEKAGGISLNGCMALTFMPTSVQVTHLEKQHWSPLHQKEQAHLFSTSAKLVVRQVAIVNKLIGLPDEYFIYAAELLQWVVL